MNQTSKKKILIGLTEVCGYYNHLTDGLKKLGEDVTFVNLHEHPFHYAQSSHDNLIIKTIRLCTKSRDSNFPNPSLAFLWYVLELPLRFLLFLWALINFDVFIFGATCSFFKFRELFLLKLFGKKIICVFHGSDSRPPYMSGLTYSPHDRLSVEQCIKLAQRQKKLIRLVEKYADIIVNHPPSAQFHERPFVMWLTMGIPQKLPSSSPVMPSFRLQPNKPLKIVHAPTNPACKGTATFRQMTQNMIRKGYSLDLIELVGIPNQEILRVLSECDFVLDELYCDTPMATFACEAALFAKPAVVGGYGHHQDFGNLPEEAIPPTLYGHPDQIEGIIEKLIANENYRWEMGKNAFEFIQKSWSREAFAKRHQMLIYDTFPKEWLYDPQRIRYVHGWGLPEAKCKEFLKEVITKGGIKALQLQDKPELEKAFLKFAGIQHE